MHCRSLMPYARLNLKPTTGASTVWSTAWFSARSSGSWEECFSSSPPSTSLKTGRQSSDWSKVPTPNSLYFCVKGPVEYESLPLWMSHAGEPLPSWTTLLYLGQSIQTAQIPPSCSDAAETQQLFGFQVHGDTHAGTSTQLFLLRIDEQCIYPQHNSNNNTFEVNMLRKIGLLHKALCKTFNHLQLKMWLQVFVQIRILWTPGQIFKFLRKKSFIVYLQMITFKSWLHWTSQLINHHLQTFTTSASQYKD